MVTDTCQLGLPGRLVLWTLRHWAQALQRQQDLPGFVRMTLDRMPGNEPLEEAVGHLFAALNMGARRPLRLGTPDRQRLTRDEQTLLTALLAARFELRHEVRHSLADLQSTTGLRSSVRASMQIGAIFRRTGWRLMPRHEKDYGSFDFLTSPAGRGEAARGRNLQEDNAGTGLLHTDRLISAPDK